MSQTLEIQDFLKQGVSTTTIVDVRSPSEYSSGHIPGSVNIPLFSDDERKVVGTIYKKSGRDVAIKEGFKILSAKFSQLMSTSEKEVKNGSLALYCWRGGMRSQALSWLFEKYNIKTYLLKGGYKSYRKLVRHFFSSKINLRVVGGMTGSGKTEILKEMRRRGHQVIDLEHIAHHKGSAFGSLGEEHQPTNEQFENDLLFEFLKLDIQKPIWIEDESRSIGRIFIPTELFEQMRATNLYLLHVPLEKRVENLVKIYSEYENSKLGECITKIGRRIGGQHLNEALKQLEDQNYPEVARIALKYYDKTYHYGIGKRNPSRIIHINSKDGDPVNNSNLLEQNI
ncbi:MAG: tRNA 2-selenouridine(34) synthase MnmH [Bacteroidales bacterium]